MNLDDLIDFANKVNEDISRYWRPFVLNPSRLLADDFVVPHLDWHAIPYGRAEINQVPNDRRGVYAFCGSYRKHRAATAWLYLVHGNSRP